MSLRPILRWPHEMLSTPCAAIGEITPQIKVLAADLIETMYDAPGRGLAAPQVGVLKRLFVMDVTWKDGAQDPRVFVDPVILDRSSEQAVNSEGCLSIPGVSTDITRPLWVEMQWRDLSGVLCRQKLEDFAAVCAQHELDHLDGIVTLDRLPDATRADVIAQYNESAA